MRALRRSDGILLALLVIVLAGDGPNGPFRVSPLYGPISTVWPAVNHWNDRLEREFGDFVAAIGAAVAARRCSRLEQCLADPSVNITYERAVDAHLHLDPDCADLPYLLRAYFSFKRRLPFGFVSQLAGGGLLDPRYAVGQRSSHWSDWREFSSPRSLFHGLTGTVHSGMYRIAASDEGSDFYPVRIDRVSVRAGTIFYDPNGHVALVSEVRSDGAVYFVDGHPDGSLTSKRFGEAFILGSPRAGGGFKNFRPIALDRGELRWAPNASLADLDGTQQYDPSNYRVEGAPVTFQRWIRAALADTGASIDPATEVREQVRALCEDVRDRALAVDAAISAGLPLRAHPDRLPANIYGTVGEWEQFSTPSRDARLKAAFRELHDYVAGLPDLASRRSELCAAWQSEVASAACQFTYRDSAHGVRAFSLDTVLDRLFALSFDPYHCPELRWGAADGSAERAACPDDAVKLRWYRDEARLRNRIDREYGVPTPLEFGPLTSPDVDVRTVLR